MLLACVLRDCLLVIRCRAKESGRLQAVLASPQFQADPIAAVTKHLEATLPPIPPPDKQPNAEGGKRRRRRGRPHGAGSLMEQ
jgi:hypothetical protein